MANSIVWISVALICITVPSVCGAVRSHTSFKVERTHPTISIETLRDKLSKRIEISPGKDNFKDMFVSRNFKIGKEVASSLINTSNQKEAIIEKESARNLLALNYFEDFHCSSRRDLSETCRKFCSKKEAELYVLAWGSDYVHLNLGIYCWQIVEIMKSKCRKWNFAYGVKGFFTISEETKDSFDNFFDV